MSIPTDRKYAATHEWFKAEGHVVTMGITRFATEELTDVTFVDLPEVGANIEAGQPFGEIESVKATSELVSPVAGQIIEINTRLADAPELVNEDPFNTAWMVKIKTSNPSPLAALMDAPAYDSHCAAQQQ